ncbi:hypothetical protein CK203_110572 [Vitis vinifera]|uniref:Uncharacterized protein n=1 Tax=Vitis vinifera TaxID=29760 RepID=A0A438CFH5_VITVI|nr:hypothetical protein CK203_110572 [Vitis vinifera]
MNFMSYVAKVSRGWDEPNARDKGRMTYGKEIGRARNDKYATSASHLSKHHCKLCLVPFVYLMSTWWMSVLPFQPRGKCLVIATPTIPIGDHPNFSWKLQPPQYQQPAQAPQQASNLEQAMVNLCKVVGDFVGKQEATNARVDQRMDRVDQRIDRMESTLNKRMDEMQNDLSQKLDILQDSISRLANLNTMQEKENSPSQPYQNSKGIHVVEAQEEESSMEKEVKEVITLRSGKEVDLPTCKLEHKVESETEKENREEIKGRKRGKSIEKDDYDFDIDEEPQKIVIKEELMKKHMPPPFLQALFLDDQNQEKLQEIEEKKSEQNRSKIGVKRSENRGETGEKQGCETTFGTRVPTSQHSDPHFAAAKRLRSSKA